MDYLTLQNTIKEYLYKRKDLDSIVPTFIELAESKIYRELRAPENEAIFTTQAQEGEAFDFIEQPADFLEVKMLTINDKPLERVREIVLTGRRAIDFAQGEPSVFARVLNQLRFWRFSDSNYEIELYYWNTFADTLVADTDVNPILTAYPDLYLFGALNEAMPYLVDDARGPVWQTRYQEAIEYVNGRTIAQEYSGSPVSVSSVYPDPLRGHQRGRGGNTV